MKIKVTIETYVETGNYEDVKSPSEAVNLIAEAMEGMADWPDAVIFNENGYRIEMKEGFRRD